MLIPTIQTIQIIHFLYISRPFFLVKADFSCTLKIGELILHLRDGNS